MLRPASCRCASRSTFFSRAAHWQHARSAADARAAACPHLTPAGLPLVVHGLGVASGLVPLCTIAAIVCAGVPTAKDGVHPRQGVKGGGAGHATVSITMLRSLVTPLGRLQALSDLSAGDASPRSESIQSELARATRREPPILLSTRSAARSLADRRRGATNQLCS
jgi:hypothetical protein